MPSVLLALILILAPVCDLRAQVLGPILMSPSAAAGLGNNSGTFHDGEGCNTGSTSCGSAVNVTVGDLLICMVGYGGTGITLGCHDSDSDTFAAAAGPTSVSTTATGEMLYAIASHTNATETITCTTTSSAQYTGCEFYSITPASSPTLDQNPAGGTFTTTTAAASGTTGTTRATNEIVIGGFGTFSAGETYTAAGWSNLLQTGTPSSRANAVLIWKNVTSASTYQATATASVNVTGVGLIATFGH